jgi:hypothetical protein
MASRRCHSCIIAIRPPLCQSKLYLRNMAGSPRPSHCAPYAISSSNLPFRISSYGACPFCPFTEIITGNRLHSMLYAAGVCTLVRIIVALAVCRLPWFLRTKFLHRTSSGITILDHPRYEFHRKPLIPAI